MAIPDVKVTTDNLEEALVSVCQFLDFVFGSRAWDTALNKMDLEEDVFEEQIDVIRSFIGYDPDDIMGRDEPGVIVPGADDSQCVRCGCDIDPETGLCGDTACPFSEHAQDCPAGWANHPAPPATAFAGAPCTCHEKASC